MPKNNTHPFDFLTDAEISIAHSGAAQGFDEGLASFLELFPAHSHQNESEGCKCPCLPWDDCTCSRTNGG